MSQHRDIPSFVGCDSLDSNMSSCFLPGLDMEHESAELFSAARTRRKLRDGTYDPMSLFLCELFDGGQEDEDREEKLSSCASDQPERQPIWSAAIAKKKRVRRSFTLPRIVKKDIRRDLSTMYANAVNSGDKAFIATFFRRFCVPQCQNVDVFSDPDNPANIVHKQVTGVENIISRIWWYLERSPDMSLHISDVQIYRRKGVPGCRISMRASLSGTVAFKPKEGTVDMTDTCFVAQSAPYESYTANHTFILALDEENRITQIQVVGEYVLPSGYLA